MLSQDVREKTLHVISLLELGIRPGGRRLVTLASACSEAGVSYGAFRYAVTHNPDLKEMYERALALSEDVLADILLNIDEVFPDAKMAAVVSKNIQWLLARRRRQDYGDHVTVEHTTSRDQKLLQRLREARERVEKAPPGLIDGEVVSLAEGPDDASPSATALPSSPSALPGPPVAERAPPHLLPALRSLLPP